MGPLKGELRLAREAFLRGDYVQAVQHCNTAIQLSPASYDAQLCVRLTPHPPPVKYLDFCLSAVLNLLPPLKALLAMAHCSAGYEALSG